RIEPRILAGHARDVELDAVVLVDESTIAGRQLDPAFLVHSDRVMPSKHLGSLALRLSRTSFVETGFVETGFVELDSSNWLRRTWSCIVRSEWSVELGCRTGSLELALSN